MAVAHAGADGHADPRCHPGRDLVPPEPGSSDGDVLRPAARGAPRGAPGVAARAPGVARRGGEGPRRRADPLPWLPGADAEPRPDGAADRDPVRLAPEIGRASGRGRV